MDSFAKNHQLIKVNDGKKCYSIGLLEANDAQETKCFYEELEEYIGSLGLCGSLFTIICQIAYGIKNDNNHFMYSNIYKGCYVSEIINEANVEGGNCIIILQPNPTNKEILNISLEVRSIEKSRISIC